MWLIRSRKALGSQAILPLGRYSGFSDLGSAVVSSSAGDGDAGVSGIRIQGDLGANKYAEPKMRNFP